MGEDPLLENSQAEKQVLAGVASLRGQCGWRNKLRHYQVVASLGDQQSLPTHLDYLEEIDRSGRFA